MEGHLSANGAKAKAFAALNCIDLSNPDIQQSAALIKQACLDSGFFYVINHGISQELIDEVFAQGKKFFEMPFDEKMKLFRNGISRGYKPPLQEILDYKTNRRDHKEVYDMGPELPEDDTDAKNPLFAPNVWPPTDILPSWKDTMQRYHQEGLGVIRAISRIIALALDLNIDFFYQLGVFDKPLTSYRIIHYKGQVIDLEREIPGTAAHTDFGFLTLLATDDALGLQICGDKYAKPQIWEYVQPLKGAFIVNIGDLLERLSNCVFRSTLHRVIVDQDRYSLALFFSLNRACVIECLPTCKSDERPPKFPPIKCEEYLISCIKDLYHGRQNDNKVDA